MQLVFKGALQRLTLLTYLWMAGRALGVYKPTPVMLLFPLFYFETRGEGSNWLAKNCLKWPLTRCTCLCSSAHPVAAYREETPVTLMRTEPFPVQTTDEPFGFSSEGRRTTPNETRTKERTLYIRFTRHNWRHVTRLPTTTAVNSQLLTSLQPRQVQRYYMKSYNF